jgi:tetratricopeptide (TPR) repeat protein
VTRLAFCKTAAVCFFVLAHSHTLVFAQESCSDQVGRFASLEGQVQVQRAEQQSWRAAMLTEPLCKGDTVHVEEHSRAAIVLANEAVMRLDQNTTMRLTDVSPKKEQRSWIEVLKGVIQTFIRKPHLLSVNTPYLNGFIEGTEFQVSVADDQASLLMLEGRVKTSNDKGSVTVTSGQMAEAKSGEAPVMHVVVRPQDAVQWTLYYPPILETLAGKVDTTSAFAELDKVPEDQRDANYHIRKAALLLKVGHQDEASAELDTTLRLNPKAGLAYAIRAIIHVVRNERDQALAEARKAVALGDTVAARIALSYAQQSAFHIEAARDIMLGAVKQHPEDAEAWARLSELQLMLGERDRARVSADKAVALAPNLVRTQKVLGFAALAEIKTKEAQTAFETAIAQDSADPLPHLGLGLAEIRQGRLEAGRSELDIAVALDSNNALLRAYLGKAYFEEKRGPLDAEQYSIAKQLDPKDPTAYFYDAIRKQTTNQPVEALGDMQKAIDLNDNRAVYRSRLLLDSDLAARSASQARIYTDLGFQQLGLVEGWKSVNTDPSNFSAHRFLADTYSVLPRHEIARVSELLQSQLLQPLNTTPIQPRLGESNLFLISAQGPAALSFNEFNPVFVRDGLTVQASGQVGEDSTYGGEGVVSGIYKKMSLSVGYSHFETDGFRENADQDDDIANIFAQWELSPQTSIQGEYRYRNLKRGDTRLRFFPVDVFPGQRNEEERQSARFGFRHALSPDSIILGSVIYNDVDASVDDQQFPDPFFPGIFLRNPVESWTGEFQHLFRSRRFNLTTGIGAVSLDGSLDSTFTTIFPPPDDIIRDMQSTDAVHANAYTYAQIKARNNLDFTLGVSGDIVEGDSEDFDNISQVNPKLGVLWNPFRNTLLRAAAFRVLKRTLTSGQTIEPTQVAGFNQFFDDLNGTDAWRFGGAIDQKFTNKLYGGGEFTYRALDVPFVDATDPLNIAVRDAGWDEYFGRAYLFWTPHPWWALSTEFLFERLERDEKFTAGVSEVDTYQVPLAVRFFHPSGLSAALTTTYWNQDGTFTGVLDNNPRHGSDNFWTVNLGANYRLPKRYGLITVGVTNLTNEDFRYYDADFKSPVIQPTRQIFARITLAFP